MGRPTALLGSCPGIQTFLRIIEPATHSVKNHLTSRPESPRQSAKHYVQRDGQRHQAGIADLVSVVPVTNIATQGESYFFLSSDKTLRTGMRLAAWIPLHQKELSGVVVPAAAIVWHLGQSYAYIQVSKGQFVRRMIPELISLSNGYFVQQGIAPGEHLVSSGAQMLLSEEFRGQIPDDDNDD